MSATAPDTWLARLARRRAVWIAVFTVALLARVAFLVTAPPRMMWADGLTYEKVGWELVQHGRYSADPIIPPGYPFFIAGVFRITGRSLLGLRVAEVLLSFGAVVAIAWFGVRLLSPPAGLLAASLAALHPVLAILPVTQYPENLLLMLTTLALGVMASALLEPGRRMRWFGAGALFGLCMLCKPAVTGLLPGLALGAWLRTRRMRVSALRSAALFAAGLLMVLLPWTLRNHAVYGRWFMVSIGGGYVMWMGNNPTTTGRPDEIPVPPTDIWLRIGVHPHPVDRDAYFFREAVRFMRTHPGRTFQLYLAKMGNLWALYPRTHTHTRYSLPLAAVAQGCFTIVLYAGALMGLARMWRRGLGALPLAVVSYTLMTSWFFTVMRHRLSVEVVLLWLAGAGWAALLQRPPRSARPARPAAPAG